MKREQCDVNSVGMAYDQEMREKRMSISEIARQIHMSRNTVKKHLRPGKPLEYKRKRRKSKLDPEKRRESNINKLTL